MKHVLKPVGSFMGGAAEPGSPGEKHRLKYRWLLTRIEDPHGNTVLFDYNCPDAPQCYLTQITYPGTVVDVYFDARPDAVSYGTGVGLGRSTKRMKAVRVKHGGAVQKAIAIRYEENPTTGLSRIASVTPYGKDAQVTSVGVVTGAELPAQRFDYSNTAKSFSEGSAGSYERDDVKYGSIWDPNGDGRDSLVRPVTGSYTFPICLSGGGTNYSSPFDMREYHEGAEWSDRRWTLHLNDDRYIDYIVVRRITYRTYDAEYQGRVDYAVKAVLSEGSNCSSFIPYNVNASDGARYVVEDKDGDGIDVFRSEPSQGSGQITSDYDGDGIRDWRSTDYQTIHFSSGGSFAGLDLGSAWRSASGDVNGDGLTDVVAIRGDSLIDVRVYLSTGDGLTLATEATAAFPGETGAGDWGSPGPLLKDLNGDGRADLMVRKENDPRTFFAVMLGHDSIVAFRGWAVTFPPIEPDEPNKPLRKNGDLNGDGLPDFLLGRTGQFSFSNGPLDNLMVSARNGYGAEIVPEYSPSTRWSNERMASVEPTVTRITVKDGRGGSAKTEYAYGGGKYDFARRRFLGFATETEYRPCTDICPVVARQLSQELASIGAVTKETVRRGAGAEAPTLRQTNRTFTASTSRPYTSLLTSESVYHHRSPSSTAAPQFLTTRRTWTYHSDYGTVLTERDYGRHGTDGVTGDEKLTAFDYYPNKEKYIVSLKALERVFAGTSSADLLMSRTEYRYDDAGAYTTKPEFGNLTLRRVSTGTGAVANETFDHDTHGNVVWKKEPEGLETEWDFDNGYRLYPVKETKVLQPEAPNHLKLTSWNFPCGQPAVETDVNGYETRTDFDNFCRKALVSRPASGGFEEVDYLAFGDPALQRVRTRRPHPDAASPKIMSQKFFDGLGRVWREEASGPTEAQPIVVARSFDARGNPATETLPYYEGATARVVGFGYDGLDRLTRKENPDGTARTFVHDIDSLYNANDWAAVGKVTETDELGHDTVTVSDAWGRPLEITRFLAGPSAGSGQAVVEKRRYDRLGRLTRLVDPRGSEWEYKYDYRGLRTEAKDPDLGLWRYSYDLSGRLKTQTDARGLVTTLGYDKLGRVTTKRSPRPGGWVDVVENAYDENRGTYLNRGRLTRAVAKVEPEAGLPTTTATVAYDYDSEGFLARERWTVDGEDHWLTTRRASGGEVLWRSFPRDGLLYGETVGASGDPWRYDPAGRLFSIPGVIDALEYRADGQTREARYPNGVTSVFDYDFDRAWLDRVEHRKGSQNLFWADYVRDDLGRILGISLPNDPAEEWEYRYDDLDRLLYSDNLDNTNAAQRFTYDAAGNMLQNSKLGDYTYPGPGQARPHAPLTAGSRSYTAACPRA